MSKLSRRDLVLSAATAAAVFGLDKQLAFISPAHAQKAPAAPKPTLYDKGFHKFKLGDVEVIQLYDGLWAKPHDAGFIKNATIDETKAALKAGGLTDAHVPIPFTVTVVKIKGEYVMFDAGTGGQTGGPDAGQIMARNIYKAGIEPSKIKKIIVTHFHPDHISGLMGKETNSQVFPDAEIFLPAAEFKFWAETPVDSLPEGRRPLAQRVQATFPKWKNVRKFESGKEITSGIRSVATHGHTPGHTSFIVSSGRKQLIVSGDVTNIATLFVKNPHWQVAFDADAKMAEESRRKLFDQAIADKAIVTGYHWGLPGAGTIKKDGNGYAYVPVKA